MQIKNRDDATKTEPQERAHVSNNPKPLIIEKKTHKNDNPKPSSRQQQVDPTLNLVMLDVKPGRDDARFVQSAVELDDDFAGAVVVDDFKFAYVACRERVSRCSACVV